MADASLLDSHGLQPRSRSDRARRDVLAQACALPDRDRLWLLQQLVAVVGAAPAEDDPAAMQVALRARVLERFEQISVHLGLPNGQAPGVRDLDRVPNEVRGGLTRSECERAFGSWGLAQQAFVGGQSRELDSTRQARKAAVGRERSHEGYLAGVTGWLGRTPKRRRRIDYDCWVREQRLDGRYFPLAATITGQLGLTWAQVLAHGEGKQEPLADTRAPQPDDYGDLVGVNFVAERLDLGSRDAYLLTRQQRFPAAAVATPTIRLWLRADVEAYLRDEPTAVRKKGFLREAVLFTPGMCKLLGVSRHSYRPSVSGGQAHLFPEPAGRASNRRWWRRADVERWLENHEPARATARRRNRRSS